MGEQLTVRLFVRTQTYDIPCDPRQPAKWLLAQAKHIQRSTLKQLGAQPAHPEDELEVLFNRSTRQVIDLAEPIGSSIAPTDVVDARTLLQTPDTTYSSALFPWLRSYPGGLALSEEVMGSSNGLFFQQLYAFTLIGKRSPMTAGERKKKQDQETFLALLETYVLGSYDHSSELQRAQQPTHQHGLQQNELYQYRNTYANHSAPTTPHHSTGLRPRPTTPPGGYGSSSQARRGPVPVSPPSRNSGGGLVDFNNFSDSGSDNTDDSPTAYPTRTPDYAPPQSRAPIPVVPAPAVRRGSVEKALEGFDNVFDIVFKQQAIGMKLGADESKRFAVVKECFEGSEARRYPEIQSGVVILAVNGQEVTGLGLSRVLYRLREAPRPVVVRFGRLSRPSFNGSQQRTGTWG